MIIFIIYPIRNNILLMFILFFPINFKNQNFKNYFLTSIYFIIYFIYYKIKKFDIEKIYIYNVLIKY